MTIASIKGAASLLAGAAMLALSTGGAAQASERHRYDLPAQDLQASLQSIASTAGIELYMSAAEARGLSAERLQGDFTAPEAIAHLLAGTNLSLEWKDGAAIIKRVAEKENQLNSSTAIVVTGSRIEGAPPVVPVTTISQVDIQNAGHTDLGQVARSLPQNFGGGQSPEIGTGLGSENANVNGASIFNLRGIGPSATLTLINGNRFSASGIHSSIDVSAIPVSAVERIEIVADGASAIYGADAVAGVVNILLRKDYEGVSTSARVGASTDGGNFQQQYNILGGKSWSSGGIMLSADHSRNTPVYARQRSYTAAASPGTALLARQKRVNFLLSAHQNLTDRLNFSVDALFKEGRMNNEVGRSLTLPVTSNGIDTHTRFQTFGVAPTLELSIFDGWKLRASAFYGQDNTKFDSENYSGGNLISSTQRYYRNESYAFDVDATGTLAMLPSGAVKLALGGGMRSNTLDFKMSGKDFSPKRNNYFAFSELFVPLAQPSQNIGWAHRAAITGALRWEDYSGAKSLIIPKLGLSYSPAEALTLGLSWGKSFKLPTLYQQYGTYAAILLPGTDYGTLYPPNSTYIYALGSNANVGPERSENFTASVTLRPSPSLTFDLTMYRIDYQDRVATPLAGYLGALTDPRNVDLITFSPSLAQQNVIIQNAPNGLGSLTTIPYDPANVVAILDGRDRNIARQRFQGIDLSVNHRQDLSDGQTLTLSAAGSWLDAWQRLRPDVPTSDISGLLFRPAHFRARLGATYDRDAVTFSVHANHISAITDRRRSEHVTIGDFRSVDITARAKIGAIGDISLSALNIFNEKPPVIRTTSAGEAPYDSTNHSSVGRFLSLTLRRDW